MRFGSKEVTSLTGATEAMQPTLSVTKKPKAYTLSIEGPTKVKYQKGEAFDKAGLVVKATSTADGTVKTLTEATVRITTPSTPALSIVPASAYTLLP